MAPHMALSSLQLSSGRPVFARMESRHVQRPAQHSAVLAKAQKVTESSAEAAAAAPAEAKRPAVAPSPAINVIQPISKCVRARV